MRALPMNPDRLLAEAALAGVPGAFERLVREYQRLCWHIVYRMVRDREDAHDLCQETFLRVHRSLGQYRGERPLRAWIGRIAYSVALRHLERRRALPEAFDDAGIDAIADTADDGFDLAAAHADPETLRRLHAAIDALPPLQRTVLTLYHLDDVPIGDIAAITGVPAGTIKSHLFRSRLKLRESLERPIGAEP